MKKQSTNPDNKMIQDFEQDNAGTFEVILCVMALAAPMLYMALPMEAQLSIMKFLAVPRQIIAPVLHFLHFVSNNIH